MTGARPDPLARMRAANAAFDEAWDIALMLGGPYVVGAYSDDYPDARRSPERQKLFDDVRAMLEA